MVPLLLVVTVVALFAVLDLWCRGDNKPNTVVSSSQLIIDLEGRARRKDGVERDSNAS